MVDDAFQEFKEGLVGRNVFEKFRKDKKKNPILLNFFRDFKKQNTH